MLSYSIEGRKRVKSQLLKMDETYGPGRFSFKENISGKEYSVKTMEEDQYPEFFDRGKVKEETELPTLAVGDQKTATHEVLESGKHIQVIENQKGISFEKLFSGYLKGASSVTVQDPYIRHFHQVKNLSEFIQMLLKIKPVGDEVDVKLITKKDPTETNNQDTLLSRLQENLEGSGVNFNYEFDSSDTFHARSISTDTGWKIILDRGLDIFQQYDFHDAFCLANNIQEERLCKAFEVTYIRNA